jgi:hypothetical protein
MVHQLPARPSNLRVHIWRRLQQIGAVSLRGSIYVLPNNKETREDFDWIRAEIAGRSGQVSIFAADVVDGYTNEELEHSFVAARAEDYDALLGRVRTLSKQLQRKQAKEHRLKLRRSLGKLREQWAVIKAIDFFEAPRAADVQHAIDAVERASAEPEVGTPEARLDARFFHRRTWLTRPRPGIDRMASAWLIRRFIDSDAVFVFGALPAPKGHVPFDMPQVEFGHQGERCTFETLAERFGISDVAVRRVGQLVHDLDLKETRYALPDTGTIGRLVQGLRAAGSPDDQLLSDGIRLIEALYQSYCRELADTPGTAKKHVRRRGRRSEKAS